MPTPAQRENGMLTGVYMDQPVIYKQSTCYPIVNIREINYGEPHRHRETHSTSQGATQTSQPVSSSEHAEIIKQHEEMMKMLAAMQKPKVSGLSGDAEPVKTYPLSAVIIMGVGALAFGMVASKLYFGRK